MSISNLESSIIGYLPDGNYFSTSQSDTVKVQEMVAPKNPNKLYKTGIEVDSAPKWYKSIEWEHVKWGVGGPLALAIIFILVHQYLTTRRRQR